MRGNYARIETVYRWSPCCRRRPVKGEELWLDPVEHSALASKVRKYESTFVLSKVLPEVGPTVSSYLPSKVRKYLRTKVRKYESTFESTKVLSKVRVLPEVQYLATVSTFVRKYESTFESTCTFVLPYNVDVLYTTTRTTL